MLELGHVCHPCYMVLQGDLLAPFRACSHGAAISETTQSDPQVFPFFVCYGSITKGTGATVINRVMLGRAGFIELTTMSAIRNKKGGDVGSHFSWFQGL